MSGHRTISIVIITKDTKELLSNLLTSINEDLPLQPRISRIIVIDNASADGTETMIRQQHPSVVYVRNEKNMGFAFSANKGASLAEGEYVLFLNSDTILIPGEAEKMVRLMDGNSDIGVCGPQLVHADMKPQRSVAAIPSLGGEIFPRRGFRLQGVGSDTVPPSSSTHLPSHPGLSVPSLIGAAILVRRESLKSVGGFDERFFFFLEETDLCVRMWQAGHKVVFLSDAKIIHLQGKTVRRSWINGRIEYNISLQKFIKKHHSSTYYRAFVTVRFLKTFFLCILFPLPLFSQRLRIKYFYYLRLMSWYLAGCPDDRGLRPGRDR